MVGALENSLVANHLSLPKIYCIDDSLAAGDRNFAAMVPKILRPELSFLQIFNIICLRGINKDPGVQVILVTNYKSMSRYL
jgi:hypothetical protein